MDLADAKDMYLRCERYVPPVRTPPAHIAHSKTGVYRISPVQSLRNFSAEENCFFPISIFISVGNMPSRFFRRRRRRHAPKSFPNNLERCAARAEDDGRTVFSLSRGHFHRNIVPHFPSFRPSSLFTRVLSLCLPPSSMRLLKRGSVRLFVGASGISC